MRRTTVTCARILAVSMCLTLLVAAVAKASPVALQVDVAGSFLGGRDFDHVKAAPSFEVLGSVMLPTSLDIGIGANVASHDIDNTTSGNADLTNVFGEIRYRFARPVAMATHWRPFLSARVGYSRLTMDSTPEASSRDGFLVGGGGGSEYWFTDQVAAVGSAILHYVGFSDSGDGSGSSLAGTMTDLRVGFKVRF